MDAIERLIAIARRRSRNQAAVLRAVRTGIVLGGIAWLLAIIERFPAEPIFDWWWLGGGLLFLLLVDVCLGWWQCRPGDDRLAAAIDARVGLDDRLSTAWYCSDRSDPVAQAAKADGIAAASDPRTGEVLRRTWRTEVPAHWWAVPTLVLCVVLTCFLGQADLMAASEPDDSRAVEAGVRPGEDMEEIMASIEQQPELREQLAGLLEELEAEQAMDADRTMEQQQRDELKRMTELQRKLEDLTSGEVAQSMESMRESLRDLESPEQGQTTELMESLSRGDFAEAAKELEAIQEQLERGDLSESERASMAEEFQSLSDQLQQLADDRSDLKDALRQAGLDPQLADDKQSLQQAMDQAEQLSEQQKQDLQELVEAQELSQEELQQLAEATEQMCKECKGGKTTQQSGQKLSKQLSKMEQMKQMLKQARETSGQCRSKCQSLGQQLGGRPGSTPGLQGRGQEQAVLPTDTDTEGVQATTTAEGGSVIAEQQVEGMLRTGESLASFQDVLSKSRDGFDDAFNDDRLPRKYHDLIKYYFGDAGEVTEAVEYDAGQADDAAEDDAVDGEPPAPSDEDSGSEE